MFLTIIFAAIVASACGILPVDADPEGEPAIPTPTPTSSTADSTEPNETEREGSGPTASGKSGETDPSVSQAQADGFCPGLTATNSGSIESAALTEVSGVVTASDGQSLWVHNDSGDRPVLYRVGFDGADLGEFVLASGTTILGRDIEDIARDTQHLYLGDIGDNSNHHPYIQIIRVAEPSLTPPDEVTSAPSPPKTEIESYQLVDLFYPDHPQDAEALIVDPATGSIIVVTKDPTSQRVYIADAPIAWGGEQELRLLADISPLSTSGETDTTEGTTLLDQFQQFSALLNAATGADLRADGAALALRTYGEVRIFPLDPSQPIDQAIVAALSQPEQSCVAPTPLELQGEAVAFLDATSLQVVTIAEGLHSPINGARTD